MSSYNNVLGNFYVNDDEDLTDLDDLDDDEDEEPSVSETDASIKKQVEPEKEEGEAEDEEEEESMPKISTNASNSHSDLNANATRKSLILGDYQLVNVIDCEEHILSCKFSPYDDVIAVGLGNGSIKIYSLTGQLKYVLNDHQTKTRRYPVTSIRFYGDKENPSNDRSKMLAGSYTHGYVKLWHYPTQQCVLTLNEESRQCLALDFNCQFSKLFVGGSDWIINGYDLTKKCLIHQYKSSSSLEEMNGHKNRVYAVCCHPRMESIFLSGGWDETVHYWDERTSFSQKHFSGPFIGGDSLDISSEHQTILTGSWRKHSTLQIWDFATGKLLKDPFEERAQSMLYSVKYSSKDLILCSGNDPNQALVYDYASFKMIGGITNLDGAVYCSDIDRMKTNFILGTDKHLWILSSKSSKI